MKNVLQIHTCVACDIRFTREDALRVCSNCFACTGCEIYFCPNCGYEVVVKPLKFIKNTALETGNH